MKAYNLEMARKYPLNTITRFSMRSRNLKAIPKEVAEMKNLEELDLYGNRIEVLPEWMIELSSLKQLNLGKNQLTTFPEVVIKLKSLEELILSENTLPSLPGSIGKLTKLKSLSLDRNHLKSLPKSLGQCTELQSIDLSNNQFSKFPNILLKHTFLKKLHLIRNRVKELPEEIGRLEHLEDLDVAVNKLKEIPSTIGALRRLKRLNLGWNRLKNLPKDLENLTKLEILSISQNLFSELPKFLETMPQLIFLYFSNNKISELPSYITNMRGLKSLDISNNQISTLPDQLYQLEELYFFEIKGNKFREFPKEVLHLNLDRRRYFEGGFIGIKGKRIPQFIRKCKDANIPFSNRWAFYQVLYLKSVNDFRNLGIADWFKAMNFKAKKIRDISRTLIVEWSEENNSKTNIEEIEPGTSVSILGKTVLPKSELSRRMQAAGLIYHPKIVDTVQYVILGDFPKIAFKDLPTGLHFILEKPLVKWLVAKENPWLLNTENDQSVKNLSRLLKSQQEQNIQLAIHMMSVSGVPKKLISEIYVAQKKIQNANLKRKLRQILEMHVSEKGMDFLKFRKGFLSSDQQKEKMRTLAKETEFDVEKIISELL